MAANLPWYKLHILQTVTVISHPVMDVLILLQYGIHRIRQGERITLSFPMETKTHA